MADNKVPKNNPVADIWRTMNNSQSEAQLDEQGPRDYIALHSAIMKQPGGRSRVHPEAIWQVGQQLLAQEADERDHQPYTMEQLSWRLSYAEMIIRELELRLHEITQLAQKSAVVLTDERINRKL